MRRALRFRSAGLLLPAGTTQGGARPKTAVRDRDGRLAIAKLPAADDRRDVLTWEAVALDLARRSGIDTSPFELRRIDGDRAVLVVQRFDRGPGDERIGYLSARSLTASLQTDDVDDAMLAEHVTGKGDGEGLFRRVALTLLVGNIDDHFRNHGVLRRRDGWRLSPVFDVNPDPWAASHVATPVSDYDEPADRDIRVLHREHDVFELTDVRAATIIREVADVTADWAATAERFGVDPEAVPQMASAFDGPNRERALEIAPTGDVLVDLGRSDTNGSAHPAGPEWVPPHTRGGRPVQGYFRQPRTDRPRLPR